MTPDTETPDRTGASPVPVERGVASADRGPERRPEAASAARGPVAVLTEQFGPALQLAGLIATSLATITAIATLAGFAMEIAYHRTLGVEFPGNLDRYALAGARFILVVSPAIALFAAIPVLPVSLIWLLSLKHPRFRLAYSVLVERARRALEDRSTAALVLLMLLQSVGVYGLLEAVEIKNLLFAHVRGVDVSPWDVLAFKAGAVTSAIVHDDAWWLLWMFVRQALIPATSAVLLFATMMSFQPGGRPTTGRPMSSFWLRANLIVFGTQLVLLCDSAGVLLAHREFPVVRVRGAAAPIMSAGLPDGALLLMHRDNGTLSLYSRSAGRLWTLPENVVVEYLGKGAVFKEHFSGIVAEWLDRENTPLEGKRFRLQNGTDVTIAGVMDVKQRRAIVESVLAKVPVCLWGIAWVTQRAPVVSLETNDVTARHGQSEACEYGAER